MNPTDAIINTLEDAPESAFSEPLEIYRHDEVAPKNRENNPTPSAYVFESTGLEINRLGITPGEPDSQTQDGGVFIRIYALTEDTAKTLSAEVFAYFKQFLDDNYTETDFLNFEISSISDARASRISRQTRHYVFEIEVQTERLD